MRYLIWNFQHNQWWGPDHCGYTSDVAKAGRYTVPEAGAIVLTALPGQNVAFDERLALQKGTPEEKIEQYRRM